MSRKKLIRRTFDLQSNNYNARAFEQTTGARIFSAIEVEEYLKRLSIEPGDLVLDIGIGTGRLCKSVLQHKASVIGIDISRKMLDATRRRYNTDRLLLVLADAEHIPFLDNTFDKVAFVRTIKYLRDHREALREAIRVLVPGGTAVVEAANKWSYVSLYYPYRKLMHPLSPRDFYRISRNANLIVSLDGSFFHMPAQLYSRTRSIHIIRLLLVAEKVLSTLSPGLFLRRSLIATFKKNLH